VKLSFRILFLAALVVLAAVGAQILWGDATTVVWGN